MIKKTRKQEYYEYLNSPQWKEKRRTALDFYGRNCCLCGYKHHLQVHHRNYTSVLHEDMKDLIVLCETCHERFNKFKKEKYQEKKKSRKQKKKKDIWKNGKESKYMRNPDADKNTVTYYPHRKQFEETLHNPSNIDVPF